jgi:dihydroflavonol-4-reductase
MAERVLITGGSGFLASHTIAQALAAGYEVRTTLRSLAREAEVRAMVEAGGQPADARLSFTVADLSADTGWPEAVRGVSFVLHLASPFPAGAPKHEDELIIPAREGALRVLRAARDAGVRRLVLTSSFAAIGYGHPPLDRPFDERDWTHLEAKGIAAYVKSKTVAERAAWDFIKREGNQLELAVINPCAIFGPLLGPDAASSVVLVQQLLNGALPGLMNLNFGIVDVRDVADLHLRAMTQPAAAGERFLAAAGDFLSMREIALALKARLGDAAKKVPTRVLPSWLVRIAAAVSPVVRLAIAELDKPKNGSNEKARRVLGWSPRSAADALQATGESLLRLGLLKR